MAPRRPPPPPIRIPIPEDLPFFHQQPLHLQARTRDSRAPSPESPAFRMTQKNNPRYFSVSEPAIPSGPSSVPTYLQQNYSLPNERNSQSFPSQALVVRPIGDEASQYPPRKRRSVPLVQHRDSKGRGKSKSQSRVSKKTKKTSSTNLAGALATLSLQEVLSTPPASDIATHDVVSSAHALHDMPFKFTNEALVDVMRRLGLSEPKTSKGVSWKSNKEDTMSLVLGSAGKMKIFGPGVVDISKLERALEARRGEVHHRIIVKPRIHQAMKEVRRRVREMGELKEEERDWRVMDFEWE